MLLACRRKRLIVCIDKIDIGVLKCTRDKTESTLNRRQNCVPTRRTNAHGGDSKVRYQYDKRRSGKFA